jgi:predicted Rossmann fold flavoprotein
MPRVVVVGAGAAGTMAAIFAAAAGAETRLLERTADGGRKILISGGGRCNVLPARGDESRFVTDSSPHTLRKILRSWPLDEQIAFFERDAGLPLIEEPETGKLFPASERARDVRDRLLDLACRRGATVVFNTVVTGFQPMDGRWRVERLGQDPIAADAVVVATGGLSVPKTGSDGSGLQAAGRLGHTINPLYPALTPVTLRSSPYASLAGISLRVTLTARADRLAATATGGLLFTHNGYSGPAVLDVSHVVARTAGGSPARLVVRWTERDEKAWDAALGRRGPRTVLRALSTVLPHRLAGTLLAAASVDPRRTLSNLTRPERHRLIETLVRGELAWTGTEGYKKAEVTGGGIALSEIDPRTLESRRHKGLFLCGEMLDAFGPIGGYNFQWAWATGRAAGLGAARMVAE